MLEQLVFGISVQKQSKLSILAIVKGLFYFEVCYSNVKKWEWLHLTRPPPPPPTHTHARA